MQFWNPYASIVAVGGDYSKIRFTFQEYFRRMTEDPKRWSQPFAALLGAYSAQLGFGLPSIGGKDSMSGTFNEIDVPPTLVSFAVDVASDKNIVTPELKKAGDKLVLVKIEKDEYDLPKYDQVMDQYGKFHEDIKAGRIVASYALDANGLAAAVSKMAFGNGLGVKIEHSVDKRDLFEEGFGCIVAEVPSEKVGELAVTYTVVGEVTCRAGSPLLRYGAVPPGCRKCMEEYSGKSLQRLYPARPPKGKSIRIPAIRQKASMYANTRSRNPAYLSRYSPAPTASMTAPKPLSAQGQRWMYEGIQEPDCRGYPRFCRYF